MEEAVIEAEAPVEVKYAGFWKRFVSYIIDYAITYVIGFIMGFVLGVMGGIVGIPLETIEIVVGILGLIITWLYFALFEISDKQATPGKMALGLYVVDLNGQKISFGRATGRFFGKFISAITLCIGYMMAGWTEKKQALHDMMASCLVLSNK